MGAGKATFQDISFVKNLDKSSPQLFVKTATGEHIKEVVLTGESSGKGGQKFLGIKMTDVLISSCQQSGSDSGVPTDSFSLNFAKIEFKYYPTNRDGSLGEPVTGGWDLREQGALASVPFLFICKSYIYNFHNQFYFFVENAPKIHNDATMS